MTKARIIVGKRIPCPEKDKKLIRLVSKAYWEATGDHWYPEKRAMQYVLARLGESYDLVKRESNLLAQDVVEQDSAEEEAA